MAGAMRALVRHYRSWSCILLSLDEPEQQIAIFNTVGNLPSQPALYEDPRIQELYLGKRRQTAAEVGG